jgi:phospholipase C
MQENRAFDHYFGTLRGVRGYGDPRAVTLPSGKSVWHQPDGNGYLLPFHPTADNLGMQFLEDTPHGWSDTQAAWNGGKYDQWIPNKGRSTMAYLTRQDIPFHYALADAFTICDAYHCSLFGPTDPNRYHMWTGWVGNDGKGGGPVINNAEAGYDWSTYPERLERAGISWKIYQDIGVGLDAAGAWGWTSNDAYIGNYGDNSLLYFHQYQNAMPGSALYEKARTGTNIAIPGTPFDALFNPLRDDVRHNRLPKVSWIVAPEAFSEHGNWPANYGAWYISQVLDALTSNPEVWSKTALFVTYDENDGFFDHIVPPTPPRSAAEGASTVDASNEIFPGSPGNVRGPYGLGIRVPMIVVSPWSKGGWVCSETFDHTSLIRFLERRFAPRHGGGVIESNITGWRRAICGDLTSAFNFAKPSIAPVDLPDTATYLPPNHSKYPDYVPAPPAQQSLPKQEPGLRRARALPYELRVDGTASNVNGSFRIDFKNTGKAGACFQVRSGNTTAGPWTYTVEAGKSLANTWDLAASSGQYDLSVFGPNGFLRQFRGSAARNAVSLDVDARYDVHDYALVLRITNQTRDACRINVASAYSDKPLVEVVRGNRTLEKRWPLKSTFGWYDLTITTNVDADFSRRIAGHLENDRDSVSDPALG